MKVKETVEEAAKDFIENEMKYSFSSLETKTTANRMLQCVEFGAKWQEEKMYSEEDMISFGVFIEHIMEKALQRHTGVRESFEQFKKKV